MTEAHSSRVHGSAPTHPGSRHHCPSVALWMNPALAPVSLHLASREPVRGGEVETRPRVSRRTTKHGQAPGHQHP